MSFVNLHWYGWVIFVLTICSLWNDIIVAGVIIAHADKVKGEKQEVIRVSPSIFWTAVGAAMTLYMMGGSS